MTEGTFIYNIESYVREQPSRYYIQAITPAKGFFLYKRELEALLLQHPQMAFVAYKLSEEYLLRMEERNRLHRLKTLAQRYACFEKQHPGVALHIKGKILASYLNVRPQQLSKHRSLLARA